MTHTNVKTVNRKNGKVSTKLSEETLWNKLCVDMICLYKIHRKGKEPLILKSITIIDPITVWFKVTQYSDKKAIMIVNLVETLWLVRYLWPVDITYDQGGEYTRNKFKRS